MRIDPALADEFREWMRNKLAPAPAGDAMANLAELRGLIGMMKSATWRLIADVADREESDVIGHLPLDNDALMELDEYERPIYEEFLHERKTGGP